MEKDEFNHVYNPTKHICFVLKCEMRAGYEVIPSYHPSPLPNDKKTNIFSPTEFTSCHKPFGNVFANKFRESFIT